MSVLTNLNGLIIKQEPIRIPQRWGDTIEGYKITYISEGLHVVGFLVKPKKEDVKFPVIIYNRGGNREFGKITSRSFSYLAYLASRNYVVLASQYRGSDGGQGWDEFGGNDVYDVLHLILLAKSLSFTDPTKIVMLGYSRGGMMTYLAIKHNADIKAAAVVGGITDLTQLYHERDGGMKRVIDKLVGVDQQEWDRRSACSWPEKLRTPLLILHGENDKRVNASQAEKLAEQLHEAGMTYELVIFPGGDHTLNTHRSERNRRIFDWFERYLQ